MARTSLRHALAALSTLTSLLVAQEAAPAVLRGLDPVALCSGEEIAGREDLTAEHEGRTYRFATTANKDTFVAAPARWSIQLGGACARMGPLSGVGDPDRFFVHEHRIFVFASDACRTSFERAAAAHLATKAERPEATDEERLLGERVVQRARAFHAPEPVQWLRYRTEDARQDQTVHKRYDVGPEGRMRTESDYVTAEKTWSYARILGPDGSWFVDEGKARPMFEDARAELREAVLREPVFALWQPDTVVVARGPNTVRAHRVEEFELWCDGVSTVFGVDERGQVVTARFRGRGPDLRFKDLERTFDAVFSHGGARIATQVHTFVAGQERPFQSEVRLDVAVGEERAPEFFRLPK